MKNLPLPMLSIILPLLFPFTAIAKSEESGVPMLLQFAERYQQSEPVIKDKPPSTLQKIQQPSRNTNNKGKQQAAKEQELKLGLQKAQQRLVQQQQVIDDLQQRIEQLNKVRQEKYTSPEFDFSAVSLMFSKLRQAAAITPDEQYVKTLVTQAQHKVTEITQQLNQDQAELARVKKQLIDTNNDFQKNRIKLQEQEQIGQRLKGGVTKLRERDHLFATPEMLTTTTARQSYAAGVALGRDIQKIKQERVSWGVDVDQQALFSGVTDVFIGRSQLPPEDLNKALSDSAKMIAESREKKMQLAQKRDDEFLSHFRQKQGVQQSSSGFWYYIDYIGDEEIKENTVIGIMVKESLTDGTIINDMERDSKIMSQPLDDYPVLFQEALRLLKNHGSITLVVPPSLAYGEQGSSEIPPNATMVYNVRIADIKYVNRKISNNSK
ncbi:TPA: FKBP-type peptidyl-prolyl cis-trans isomerase N-terminal domain-containing protein [Yersinia enterocolitica]